MSLIYQAAASNTNASTRHLSNTRTRPGLYLGGKVDAKNLDKLKRWNVTHILNLTPMKQSGIQAGVPNYFESSGQFVYKRVAVLDAKTAATELLGAADSIVTFIASGLCHGSVLVHCHRGVSRSTTAVLFFLMRRLGMTRTEAMVLVKRRRPQADPIPAFAEMLEQYYKEVCEPPQVLHAETAKVKRPEGSAHNKCAVGPSLPSEKNTDVITTDTGYTKRTIGPAIGPALPMTASNKGDQARTEKNKKRQYVAGPAIGPGLPPRKVKESCSEKVVNQHCTDSFATSPVLPGSTMEIVDQERKEIRAETKRIRMTGPAIGPTLPMGALKNTLDGSDGPIEQSSSKS